MNNDTWLPEALEPFSKAVRRLYEAACARFPTGALDRRAVNDAVACERLRAWILNIGKLFGGRPRNTNEIGTDFLEQDFGGILEKVATSGSFASSGLLGAWPSQLVGAAPEHLVPVDQFTTWAGLYPLSSRVKGVNADNANQVLREMEEREFSNAYLFPTATPTDARPKLVARALEFRLHALRLAQWAKQQLRELQNALCPRLKLGNPVGKQHFRIEVTLAGFTRRPKLPDKQAELLAKLIRKKGHPVTATKQQVHDLRKSLPEISTFISEDGVSFYKLASTVCARARFTKCWQLPRPADTVPTTANPVVTT